MIDLQQLVTREEKAYHSRLSNQVLINLSRFPISVIKKNIHTKHKRGVDFI